MGDFWCIGLNVGKDILQNVSLADSNFPPDHPTTEKVGHATISPAHQTRFNSSGVSTTTIDFVELRTTSKRKSRFSSWSQSLIPSTNWMAPNPNGPYVFVSCDVLLLDIQVFSGSVDRGSCWRFFLDEPPFFWRDLPLAWSLTIPPTLKMVVWSGMKKNHPRVSKSFYDSFGLQTTCLHSHHDHLVWLAIIVSSNGRKNTIPNMSAFFTWACFRYVISLYSYHERFCVTWPFVVWNSFKIKACDKYNSETCIWGKFPYFSLPLMVTSTFWSLWFAQTNAETLRQESRKTFALLCLCQPKTHKQLSHEEKK